MSLYSFLSVRELKEKLIEKGITIDKTIIYKQELIDLLTNAESSQSIPGSGGSSPTIAMSVGDLRDIIRSLAGRTSQCCEKTDLWTLAKDLLKNKTCCVCMEILLLKYSDIVIHLPCCHEYMHVSCLGNWLVESDQLPMCPHCMKSISEEFVEKRVISIGNHPLHGKYRRMVDGLNQLKSGGNGTDQDYTRLGFRQCPKCKSWIEKGPSMEAFGVIMAEGCDKMTCRCGCRFCFKCGSVNAQCACTGPEHGFFTHEDVIKDYPQSNLTSSPMDFMKGLLGTLG